MSTNENVIDIIIDLQEKGFDHDFVLEHENIRCLQYDVQIPPDDFEILEIRPCKKTGKPKNMAIIYAIQLKNYNIKGILMSNAKSYDCGLSMHLWKKFESEIRKWTSSSMLNLY
jgi:hypothetical protein